MLGKDRSAKKLLGGQYVKSQVQSKLFPSSGSLARPLIAQTTAHGQNSLHLIIFSGGTRTDLCGTWDSCDHYHSEHEKTDPYSHVDSCGALQTTAELRAHFSPRIFRCGSSSSEAVRLELFALMRSLSEEQNHEGITLRGP